MNNVVHAEPNQIRIPIDPFHLTGVIQDPPYGAPAGGWPIADPSVPGELYFCDEVPFIKTLLVDPDAAYRTSVYWVVSCQCEREFLCPRIAQRVHPEQWIAMLTRILVKSNLFSINKKPWESQDIYLIIPLFQGLVMHPVQIFISETKTINNEDEVYITFDYGTRGIPSRQKTFMLHASVGPNYAGILRDISKELLAKTEWKLINKDDMECTGPNHRSMPPEAMNKNMRDAFNFTLAYYNLCYRCYLRHEPVQRDMTRLGAV